MAKNYEVIGPVAVVRLENKSERYIYRGGIFSGEGADAANIEHLLAVKLIKEHVAEGEVGDGEVVIPDGVPAKSWTVPQLEKFAEIKGIDLTDVKGKPEKLAAVLAAIQQPPAGSGSSDAGTGTGSGGTE